MVVLFHAFLFEHLGSGPVWTNINNYLGDICRRNWWSTLLYVQNYVNPLEIVRFNANTDRTLTTWFQCVPQSWYLSVDVQCFVFSPLLLLPLSRWPRVSIAAIIGLLAIGIIGPLIIGWELGLRALFGSNVRHLGLISHDDSSQGVFNGFAIRVSRVLMLMSFCCRFRPNSPEFLTYYYYPTHTRMAPYLVGMLLGYTIYTIRATKMKISLSKVKVIE